MTIEEGQFLSRGHLGNLAADALTPLARIKADVPFYETAKWFYGTKLKAEG